MSVVEGEWQCWRVWSLLHCQSHSISAHSIKLIVCWLCKCMLRKSPRSLCCKTAQIYSWRCWTCMEKQHQQQNQLFQEADLLFLKQGGPCDTLGCGFLRRLQSGYRGSALPRPGPAPAVHIEDLLQTLLPAPHTMGAQSVCAFGGHHSSGHWEEYPLDTVLDQYWMPKATTL